ncbi:hypothetical protein C8R46DRAFT_266637 [Mycena filopes]|nr:hypothetical protein C8R46DRAFT_266637 [Mycena filopes]
MDQLSRFCLSPPWFSRLQSRFKTGPALASAAFASSARFWFAGAIYECGPRSARLDGHSDPSREYIRLAAPSDPSMRPGDDFRAFARQMGVMSLRRQVSSLVRASKQDVVPRSERPRPARRPPAQATCGLPSTLARHTERRPSLCDGRQRVSLCLVDRVRRACLVSTVREGSTHARSLLRP